jgi:hypothetical protein
VIAGRVPAVEERRMPEGDAKELVRADRRLGVHAQPAHGRRLGAVLDALLGRGGMG